MMANKSMGVLVGGLGLCGAACLLAPGALALTAGAALAGVGSALAPNIAADIFSRLADWSGKKLRDKGAAAKNHGLRELVALSIENVLEDVIQSKPCGSEGTKLLRHFRATVRDHLDDAVVDARFKGTWEQTVPHYFRSRIEDFSATRAMTPDIWKHFLNEMVHKDLSSNEQYAIEAAADALYTQLPRHLVGSYRDALEHHPTVYVAVQTALLQELWTGVSRIDSKGDAIRAAQDKVFAQLDSIKEAIRSMHPDEFAEAVQECRVLLWTVEWLARETHSKASDVLGVLKEVADDIGGMSVEMAAMVPVHSPHLAVLHVSQQDAFAEWYLAAQEEPTLYKGRSASGMVNMWRFGSILKADWKGGVLPSGLSDLFIPEMGSRVWLEIPDVRSSKTVVGFAAPHVTSELIRHGQHGVWHVMLHCIGRWTMPGDAWYKEFSCGASDRVVAMLVERSRYIRDVTPEEFASMEKEEFDPD